MENDEKLKRAKNKVQELKGFYSHLLTYLVVNVVMIIINLVTNPHHLWFYWVTVFWGIGLIFHAFSIFGKRRILGDDWEEKKVKEYMDKDKK
ncbi:MAG: 2TM domain-containing protein [Ignavibacteria bacterium]|nr:2TM domain-containing protein [Ignavibacteria bacterium]